ncbi:hypothetical protein GALMADRAFT_243204 [Galerina marginata CBS 339.88]|uniref:MYND-type domain-containing protein n=1 Tax=Galerina marginata (strain CBS 339.88) TaxID=685588 RepID=A0A067T7U5_GALM3|nr:hypothetical protein GALMADRAFT_243204 [Galerina marginata CBS 339.88]
MSERRCEQCENCFGHVESVHCTAAVKNCNNNHVVELLTCAKCKEVRYCSKACQKIQWPEHKAPCESHERILRALKILGPRIDRTFRAFVKFSKAISGYMEQPAISALELRKGKHRVNTHVLLVKIRAKETIFKKTERYSRGCTTFKVESAECKTMDEMHDFLDWRCGPFATPEVTDRTLAHRPGLLRLFVLDTSGILPAPLDGYTLPTDISNWPTNYHEQYDPKWREHFMESIGQPKDGPPASDGSFINWQSEYIDILDQNEPRVPPARPSSPINIESLAEAVASMGMDSAWMEE